MRTTTRDIAIDVTTPTSPPYWALLERKLIAAQADAIREYYDHYFDERGYQLIVPRWGGDDGPDDAAENVINWTMLHTLGGPDFVLDLYKKGWEGHLRQYTEAKTVEVALGREGMYYKEFPVCFDWFHIGEGLSAFTLQGLSDPGARFYEARSRRYAGFYMDEDPQAPNYDPKHRIIRSMFNGSRGPLLRKATGLDWAGDPIEVEGRFGLRHEERTFQQMVDHFKDYNDVVGDNPLNIAATTLGFNAYALTGEAKYRDWVLEYVDAWAERTESNRGLIPTSVGLDGVIGSATDGKWYGGVYGWGFTVEVPQSGALANRPHFQTRCQYGFANALLLTGDRHYVDLWANMIAEVNKHQQVVDGKLMYPRMYGDEGWYDYRPTPFAGGALDVYYWTLDRSLLDVMSKKPEWVAFLDGEDASYPERSLQRDLLELRDNMAKVLGGDTTSPDTRLSDETHGMAPAITETLTKLMLGGLPTGRIGYPLHCWLRYFDPARRRAGVPEDVAALVDSMSPDGVTVRLVNLDPIAAKAVTVQGGGYAEHQIVSVTVDGVETPVDASHFTVNLAPGAGSRLTVKMKRYANQPTFAFPWQ